MIAAVIFDLDGTLIDTEFLYCRFWPQACAHFGYEMSREQALSMRSLGRPYAPQHMKEMFGEECDYTTIREYRKKLMADYIEEHGIALKKGVPELLTFLKEKGIKRAIATANDPERTGRYLRQLGIFDYFDEICCATQVEHGKPAPDVYAFAVEQIGEAAGNCFAVEDSPNGILSAKRAGCRTIMVPDQSEPDGQLWEYIDYRVDSLLDIMKLEEMKQ